MRLAEAVTYFLETRRTLSQATRAGYQSRLGAFASRMGPARNVATVTLSDLEAWYAGMYDRKQRWEHNAYRPTEEGGLSPFTVDCNFRSVRAFFNWLHKRGVITENPIIGLEHRTPPEAPPKWLSMEQVEQLLEAAQTVGAREYALIRFALATGARRGGLHGMKIEALDLGNLAAALTEKGNKTRVVHYDHNTAAALREWLAVHPGGEWLWCVIEASAGAVPGDRLSLSGLRQLLRRVCRRASMPEVGLHQLRHTFAYISAKAGVDPEQLRLQMGHADITTTYRYVRWQTEDRKATFSVDRLPSKGNPRDKWRVVTGGKGKQQSTGTEGGL